MSLDNIMRRCLPRYWIAVVAFLVLVLPFPLIYGAPLPEWKMRAIASAAFCVLCPLTALAYALHPDSQIFSKNVTAEEQLKYQTKKQEMAIRGVLGLFGIVLLCTVSWPYIRGMAALATGTPPRRIQGVIRIAESGGAGYFLYQSFKLKGNASTYGMIYFPTYRPKRNQEIVMLVLPGTSQVLAIVARK